MLVDLPPDDCADRRRADRYIDDRSPDIYDCQNLSPRYRVPQAFAVWQTLSRPVGLSPELLDNVAGGMGLHSPPARERWLLRSCLVFEDLARLDPYGPFAPDVALIGGWP